MLEELLRILFIVSLTAPVIKPFVRNSLNFTTERNLACLKVHMNLILRTVYLTISPFPLAGQRLRAKWEAQLVYAEARTSGCLPCPFPDFSGSTLNTAPPLIVLVGERF